MKIKHILISVLSISKKFRQLRQIFVQERMSSYQRANICSTVKIGIDCSIHFLRICVLLPHTRQIKPLSLFTLAGIEFLRSAKALHRRSWLLYYLCYCFLLFVYYLLFFSIPLLYTSPRVWICSRGLNYFRFRISKMKLRIKKN